MYNEVKEVKNMVKPQESSAKNQTLRVKEDVIEYSLPEDWHAKKRHQWHFSDATPWPLESEFGRFMQRKRKTDTPSDDLLDCGRLLCMFETLNGTPIDLDSFLVNVVRSGAMRTLLGTRAFAGDLDFTRQILKAMNHLRDQQTEFFRDRHDKVSIEILQELTDSRLKDTQKDIYQQRKAAITKTKIQKWEISQAAAPPHIVQSAVKLAMINVELLVQRWGKAASMPVHVRIVATQLTLFVVNYNGLAGRPLEWASFHKLVCWAQLYAHMSYVYMKRFKTQSIYAFVGKHVAKGTYDTLLAFSLLPTCDGKESELLFPPTPEEMKRTWKSKTTEGERLIEVADYVSSGSQKHLPGYPPLSPTTMRQMSHTKIKNDDTSIDFKMLSLLDTHSTKVAEEHYDLSTVDPEALAKQGERLYMKYMGTAVAYPTFAEILRANHQVEEVVKRGYRCMPSEIKVPEELDAWVATQTDKRSPAEFRAIVKEGTEHKVVSSLPEELLFDAMRQKVPASLISRDEIAEPATPRPRSRSPRMQSQRLSGIKLERPTPTPMASPREAAPTTPRPTFGDPSLGAKMAEPPTTPTAAPSDDVPTTPTTTAPSAASAHLERTRTPRAPTTTLRYETYRKVRDSEIHWLFTEHKKLASVTLNGQLRGVARKKELQKLVEEGIKTNNLRDQGDASYEMYRHVLTQEVKRHMAMQQQVEVPPMPTLNNEPAAATVAPPLPVPISTYDSETKQKTGKLASPRTSDPKPEPPKQPPARWMQPLRLAKKLQERPSRFAHRLHGFDEDLQSTLMSHHELLFPGSKKAVDDKEYLKIIASSAGPNMEDAVLDFIRLMFEIEAQVEKRQQPDVTKQASS